MQECYLCKTKKGDKIIWGKYIGFLDDLFVEPKHRRNGVGEKIIKELNTISMRNNWNLVRWITRENNTKAKSLYEKLSKKTNWEVYELSWKYFQL